MSEPAHSLPSATTSRGTQLFAQSLPGNVLDLLMSGESPIVGPKTAQMLSAFAESPEPATADRAQVEVMIGKLAMATAQPKSSDAEASEQLELYWLALRDLPVDDLRTAFVELLRSAKFLPTPAEVRTAALKAGSARRYAKSRARYLAWKHSVEWAPPVEKISAEEIAALRAGTAQALRADGDSEESAA